MAIGGGGNEDEIVRNVRSLVDNDTNEERGKREMRIRRGMTSVERRMRFFEVHSKAALVQRQLNKRLQSMTDLKCKRQRQRYKLEQLDLSLHGHYRLCMGSNSYLSSIMFSMRACWPRIYLVGRRLHSGMASVKREV